MSRVDDFMMPESERVYTLGWLTVDRLTVYTKGKKIVHYTVQGVFDQMPDRFKIVTHSARSYAEAKMYASWADAQVRGDVDVNVSNL